MRTMCSRQPLMDEGHALTRSRLQLPARASLMNFKNSVGASREIDFSTQNIKVEPCKEEP